MKTYKGYVYKITIGPYYYIGITDTTIKCRYSKHKKTCFNRVKKSYHQKVYKVIREYLKHKTGHINKEDFNKYVNIKKVTEIYTNRYDLKRLETMLINLKNDWCINSIN